jgi:hypothetical protein
LASVVVGAAEEELEVKLLFNEVGAALSVAEIFGNIAAGLHLKCDSTALKGCAQAKNSLAVGVVETLSDADDGREAAGDALVVVGEPGIGGVVAVGF